MQTFGIPSMYFQLNGEQIIVIYHFNCTPTHRFRLMIIWWVYCSWHLPSPEMPTLKNTFSYSEDQKSVFCTQNSYFLQKVSSSKVLALEQISDTLNRTNLCHSLEYVWNVITCSLHKYSVKFGPYNFNITYFCNGFFFFK